MRSEVETRAGRREWAGLAVLMLPVLLVSIDNTVLSFALPYISLDLAPSAAMQLWIVDIYPLVLAGLLVTMGSVGDRVGRRRLLLIGSTGFAAVSVVAAYSTSAEMLLVARLLLGVFGAAIMPCTLSLLRGMFHDRDQRRLAIAIWATGFAAGAAIGPIVGGVLLEAFEWGVVFLIAVPMLVPLLILAPLLITESKDPNPGPVDLISMVLSIGAMAPVVFAIKHVATSGPDLLAALCVLVGVACGVTFVRRLLAQSNPMLDMRLFAVPVFTGSVLLNLMSVMALVGLLYFLSQYIQLVLGLSPLDAGLVLLPGTVMMVAASLLVVRLVRRWRPVTLVTFGLALGALAYAILAVAGGSAGVAITMVAFSALAAGVGIAETLSNDLIIASVPPAKAGAASAVSETAYEVGAVLGTSVLGGLLAAAYRNHLDVPAGLSGTDQHLAQETLAGALAVAQRVSGETGAQLATSAKDAFASGSSLTAGIGVLLMVLAILVARRTLRHAS